jgi:hypothetical protein
MVLRHIKACQHAINVEVGHGAGSHSLALGVYGVQRQIVSHTAFPGQEFAGDRVITEKTAVDPEFDYRHTVDGPASGGGGPYHPYGYEEKPSAEGAERLALKATLEPVLNAYRLANGGKEPGDPFQLQPYVTDTTQQAALQKIIEIIKQPHK